LLQSCNCTASLRYEMHFRAETIGVVCGGDLFICPQFSKIGNVTILCKQGEFRTCPRLNTATQQKLRESVINEAIKFIKWLYQIQGARLVGPGWHFSECGF
jgi:hypothetical protein